MLGLGLWYRYITSSFCESCSKCTTFSVGHIIHFLGSCLQLCVREVINDLFSPTSAKPANDGTHRYVLTIEFLCCEELARELSNFNRSVCFTLARFELQKQLHENCLFINKKKVPWSQSIDQPVKISVSRQMCKSLLGITFLFANLSWPMAWRQQRNLCGLLGKLPPVYHTRWRLLIVPFIAERKTEKL